MDMKLLLLTGNLNAGVSIPVVGIYYFWEDFFICVLVFQTDNEVPDLNNATKLSTQKSDYFKFRFVRLTI